MNCRPNLSASRGLGFFITGTDTGVGKTHVTAALLRELRRQGVAAAAFKPIACGPGGRESSSKAPVDCSCRSNATTSSPTWLGNSSCQS
jgi:dethiobiotin synthetase